MSQGIILVRHAMSDVRHGVASRLWGITEAAREDCVLLAEHLPRAAPVFTSDERKAGETAAVLALRLGSVVVVDSGFAEADRPTTWDGEYRATAAAYLAGAAHEGWEPAQHVVARFQAAMERATVRAGSGDIVVVDHGLALTLYLAAARPTVCSASGMRAFDAAPFWSALTFPDAWRFDPRAGTVTRVFEAGLPPPDA